jgi:hypothetical protein
MSSAMLKGGHYKHNSLFKQGFVGALDTLRVTVLTECISGYAARQLGTLKKRLTIFQSPGGILLKKLPLGRE